MLSKLLYIIFLCLFCFSGCGEDEKTLSEEILGTWRCTESWANQTYTDENFVGKTRMSLTFYRNGRFDFIMDVLFKSYSGEILASFTSITTGT